jgi:hypothetical protein
MCSMRVEERILIQIIRQGILVKEGRYIVGPSFARLATPSPFDGRGSQEKRIKSSGFHMGLKPVRNKKEPYHSRKAGPAR